MQKTFAQSDLSGWLSPDEDRLLNLFRNLDHAERSNLLYLITRKHLASMFTEEFDDSKDAQDSSYMEEELNKWLFEICPKELLGEYLCEEPHFTEIVGTAWKSVGLVVLGSSENDGQRADELFNVAIRLWDIIGNGPGQRQPLDLSRSACLKFLEAWREEALSFAFRYA